MALVKRDNNLKVTVRFDGEHCQFDCKNYREYSDDYGWLYFFCWEFKTYLDTKSIENSTYTKRCVRCIKKYGKEK